MTRKPPLPLADRLRRHRAAMELALELHCTPREAAEELDRRAARARAIEAQRRLDRRMTPPRPARTADPPEDAPPPWWTRD